MAIRKAMKPVERDRWGKPLIHPVGGGTAVAYKRVTSFVSVIEDTFQLEKWKMRQVAIGLAKRPDIMLGIKALDDPNGDKDQKRSLNRFCEQATEAAEASSSATKGTAVHSFTEMIDRGQALPPGLDEVTLAMLEAYREATKDLKFTFIEQFLVNDKLKAAGTADRFAKVPGKAELIVADLKTMGSLDFGYLKIAMQMALYAHSYIYDPDTYERKMVGSAGVDTLRGLIIWLPMANTLDEVKCELHWVDLEEGWKGVLVAKQIHELRKLKKGDLTQPFAGKPGVTSIRTERKEAGVALEWSRLELIERIKAAPTADMIRDLWTEHQTAWDDDLTEIAKVAISELEELAA